MEHHITRIGRNMVELLAHRLQSGDITLSRAKEVANFYLEHISLAKTEDDLTNAMKKVHQDFPELEPIVRTEKIWRNRPTEIREQLSDETL